MLAANAGLESLASNLCVSNSREPTAAFSSHRSPIAALENDCATLGYARLHCHSAPYRTATRYDAISDSAPLIKNDRILSMIVDSVNMRRPRFSNKLSVLGRLIHHVCRDGGLPSRFLGPRRRWRASILLLVVSLLLLLLL